ncbi:MAG: M28 family peptidase [Candidatus Acidiferrum sp.]
MIRGPATCLAGCLLFELALSGTLPGDSISIKFEPVTRDVVQQRLNEFGGDNARRKQTLKELLGEAGCDGKSLSEQEIPRSPLPNVICKLPGSSGRTIIVGAHYDRIGPGDSVVDNWSGASLLPSLYEALKAEPRTHTYLFIGFGDSVKELIGSKFYVHQLSEAQSLRIDAMVDMEGLGLAPTEVWVDQSNKKLAGELAFVAGVLKLPASWVDIDGVGYSDSGEFATGGIPTVAIHSLTQKAWDEHILHTRKDRISDIHLDDYYQTYRLVAGYLAYLDYSTSTREPPEKKTLRNH